MRMDITCIGTMYFERNNISKCSRWSRDKGGMEVMTDKSGAGKERDVEDVKSVEGS